MSAPSAQYATLEVAAARSDSGVTPLMLEVTAPATLAEGYELQVCTANGDVVTVMVVSVCMRVLIALQMDFVSVLLFSHNV